MMVVFWATLDADFIRIESTLGAKISVGQVSYLYMHLIYSGEKKNECMVELSV